MTQAQLARKADTTDATLSRIERGKYTPSTPMVAKLAAALGVAPADLFDRTRPNEPTPRPAVARLVAVVEMFSDAELDDLTRSLKTIFQAAKRAAQRKDSDLFSSGFATIPLLKCPSNQKNTEIGPAGGLKFVVSKKRVPCTTTHLFAQTVLNKENVFESYSLLPIEPTKDHPDNLKQGVFVV